MITKKIFNFCVMVITILAAHLLAYSIYEYMLEYRGAANPWKFTAIGMLIIIVVFYPAIKFMDKIIKSVTKDIFRKGKSKFGRPLGILIVFFVLLLTLYYLYARHWFHIDILKSIL